MGSLKRALLALSLCCAAPALAAEPAADQAQRAFAIFAGGLAPGDFLSPRAGTTLFDNISGNWVRLAGPDPKSGMETYGADIERLCKGNGVLTLAAPTPLTMTLTTNLPGANFSQTYTLVGGSSYAEHTDPDAYFAAIGLGPDVTGDTADQQRALLLARANGRVQIFRASADILVVTREGAYPNILARCPAPAN